MVGDPLAEVEESSFILGGVSVGSVPNNRHSKKGLADSILGFSKFQPTLSSDTPSLTPLPKPVQKNS